MGEIRYMISEAAKRVHVESHVLRYWEEELNLTISRTEMGHRYYTEDDIQLFCCIKKLKNEGMLLKDLKPLIPKLKETRDKLNSAQASSNSTATQSKSNTATTAPTVAEDILAKSSAETSAASLPSRLLKRLLKHLLKCR